MENFTKPEEYKPLSSTRPKGHGRGGGEDRVRQGYADQKTKHAGAPSDVRRKLHQPPPNRGHPAEREEKFRKGEKTGKERDRKERLRGGFSVSTN